MKIKKITVWKEDLALTRPYSIAYERIDSVENLFVLLEDDNGNIGMGAGSPSEEVTGETILSCEKALNEQLPLILQGRDVMCLRALLQKLNEVMKDTPAALAAVDIALHDLFANSAGLPLVDVLGRVHDRLETSITIGIKSMDEMLEEAREYHGMGFHILKVKTGLDVEEDIERVLKLSETFKGTMRIRVDANQGYSQEDYKRFFHATKEVLEFVEQPLPALDLEGMLSLDEPLRRLAAADESLLSPKTAIKCLSLPHPFGIFNIKLMKCGGIGPGLEIANMASHAGIELMWGCMDESIISIAGALHAAFASKATRYLDLDGSLDLAKDLVTGGFIIDNGWMSTTDQPGLGVKRI